MINTSTLNISDLFIYFSKSILELRQSICVQGRLSLVAACKLVLRLKVGLSNDSGRVHRAVTLNFSSCNVQVYPKKVSKVELSFFMHTHCLCHQGFDG